MTRPIPSRALPSPPLPAPLVETRTPRSGRAADAKQTRTLKPCQAATGLFWRRCNPEASLPTHGLAGPLSSS
jgi:hypothetical protein